MIMYTYLFTVCMYTKTIAYHRQLIRKAKLFALTSGIIDENIARARGQASCRI